MCLWALRRETHCLFPLGKKRQPKGAIDRGPSDPLITKISPTKQWEWTTFDISIILKPTRITTNIWKKSHVLVSFLQRSKSFIYSSYKSQTLGYRKCTWAGSSFAVSHFFFTRQVLLKTCNTGKHFLQIDGQNFWARLQTPWNHPVWFMMSFPLNVVQFYFRNLFRGGLFLSLGCILFGWLLFQSLFLLKICFSFFLTSTEMNWMRNPKGACLENKNVLIVLPVNEL